MTIAPTGSNPTRDLRPDRRSRPVIVWIEPRVLHLQAMVGALRDADRSTDFHPFPDISTWIASPEPIIPCLIVISTPYVLRDSGPEASLTVEISRMRGFLPSARFAILSDHDDQNEAIRALQRGAFGFLPTNLSVGLIVRILHVILAGGTYVPVTFERMATPSFSLETTSLFGSERQLQVAKAVAKGKPNKIIAYELCMCESTVKVHVRNLMKRLHVKNRTEIALNISRLLQIE